MPSMEVYLKQPIEYRNRLLPKDIKTFVVEAGSSFGWEKFVNDDNCLITVNDFGVSGSTNDVLKYCNFDYESIKNKIINNL